MLPIVVCLCLHKTLWHIDRNTDLLTTDIAILWRFINYHPKGRYKTGKTFIALEHNYSPEHSIQADQNDMNKTEMETC